MEEEAAAELDANPDRDIDRAVEPIEPVPDTMLDGTLLGDEFYYYRSTLDATRQQGYDLLRAGILEGKSRIQRCPFADYCIADKKCANHTVKRGGSVWGIRIRN